jgi:hypothetical protein
MGFNFVFVHCGNLTNVENIFGPLRFRFEQVLLHMENGERKLLSK